MVPTNFLPILVSMLSQQSISQKGSCQDIKTRSFPPSTKLHPCSSLAMGPASLALAWLQVDRAPTTPLLILWLLPLHVFLLPLILSCFFFMRFLSLWLYMVSPYFTSAKSEFILIPLYKGIMGFLPYKPNPFCFLFSSFIHYIRLGLLTLLLAFLLIYSVRPHLLGSILFLYFWVFLIPILLFKKVSYYSSLTLLFKKGLLLPHS